MASEFDDLESLEDLLDASESLPEETPEDDPAILAFPSDDPKVSGGSQIGDGVCAYESCGAPTFRPPGETATGRKKRVPKYCDVHSKSERASTGGGRPQKLETRLAHIQQELSDEMKLAGALAGNVLPCTGYVMIEESDEFTAAIVRLARRHPRALAALEKASEIGPGVTVGKTLMKLGVAIQVDGGRLHPDSAPSKYMGVERVYAEIHQDYVVRGPFPTPSAPPRYSEVPDPGGVIVG